MPLPNDYTVKTAWYIDDATGQRFWGCNCPSTPPTRTLRHIAAHREQFSLPAPAPIQAPPAAPGEVK